MRIKNKEMLKEGLRKFAPFAYGNAINSEILDGKIVKWFNRYRKLKLVYRAGCYYYVPLDDKYSTENNGGWWLFPYNGIDLECYAGTVGYVFEDENKTKQVEEIFNKILNNKDFNFIDIKYNCIEDQKLLKFFFKYCKENNIDFYKFLPNYKILGEFFHLWNISSINNSLKGYYTFDKKTYSFISYNKKTFDSKKILRYQNRIECLEQQIKKYEQKISLINKGEEK